MADPMDNLTLRERQRVSKEIAAEYRKWRKKLRREPTEAERRQIVAIGFSKARKKYPRIPKGAGNSAEANPTGIPFSGPKYYRPARRVDKKIVRRRVPLTWEMRGSAQDHARRRRESIAANPVSPRIRAALRDWWDRIRFPRFIRHDPEAEPYGAEDIAFDIAHQRGLTKSEEEEFMRRVEELVEFGLPNPTKGPYPFAEKEEQYRTYTMAQLLYAQRDAADAARRMKGFDPVAEAWYLDDLHTITSEIRKRRGEANANPLSRSELAQLRDMAHHWAYIAASYFNSKNWEALRGILSQLRGAHFTILRVMGNDFDAQALAYFIDDTVANYVHKMRMVGVKDNPLLMTVMGANPLTKRELADIQKRAEHARKKSELSTSEYFRAFYDGENSALRHVAWSYGPEQRWKSHPARLLNSDTANPLTEPEERRILGQARQDRERARFAEREGTEYASGLYSGRAERAEEIVAQHGGARRNPIEPAIVGGIVGGATAAVVGNVIRRKGATCNNPSHHRRKTMSGKNLSVKRISASEARKLAANPKVKRKRITMPIEKFYEIIKRQRDPRLLTAFKKKLEGYKKWTHGTLPTKVTVEALDIPGVHGTWITYGAGTQPEALYAMPGGTKRSGLWRHPWETAPTIKHDPEAGIVLTKLRGKSKITDFYHR
jgi:hypothetical protein